jgi:hypothetical protein
MPNPQKQEEDELKKRYRDRAAERRQMEDRGELDMDDYLQMAQATPTPHVLAAGQYVVYGTLRKPRPLCAWHA